MAIQSEYLAGWPFERDGPQQFFTARAPLSREHADLKGMEVRPSCPSQPRPLPSAPVLAICQDDSFSNVQQHYVDQSVAGCAIRSVSQIWPAPTESEEMVASSSGLCDEEQSLLRDAKEVWICLNTVNTRSLFSPQNVCYGLGWSLRARHSLGFMFVRRFRPCCSWWIAKSLIAAFFCITSLMMLRSLYA